MMTMESPSGYGLVVVVSVSTSVAVLLLHLHKRMASDFINKFEFQILSSNCEKRQGRKKKVRFAEKVIEVPLEEQDVEDSDSGPELEDKIMPPNRVALYRGIIKHKTLNATLRSS